MQRYHAKHFKRSFASKPQPLKAPTLPLPSSPLPSSPLSTPKTPTPPVPKSPSHYFGVSATFRNESPYLKEWIDHNLKIGASLIILYDDRSSDSPLSILQPYINSKKVIYNKAVNFAYTYYNVMEVVKNYKNLCKWVAFIDIDEFLYSTTNNSVINTLKLYDKNDIKAVYVNWLCFGSNHSEKFLNIPVTYRFTRRADKMFGLNSEVKSIIQPAIISDCTSSHIFKLIPGHKYYNNNMESGKLGVINDTFKTNFEKHIKPYFNSYGVNVNLSNVKGKMGDKQYPPTYERLCLNHYITRSRDEYKEKAIRYDCKRPDRYGDAAFNNLNKYLNEVEDDSIHK